MSVTFHLRPEAKFADGSPLTADDVVFSFDTSKEKGKPEFSASRCAMSTKAEALDAAHRALHLQGRPDTRSAARRGRAADPVEGLLHHAPLRADVARSAARLRALRDRRLQGRHLRHLQAPARLLGQGPARQPRPLQLRRAALRVLTATARSELEEPQGRRRSTCARSSPRSTGRPATTSPAVKDGRLIRAARCPTSAPPARRAFSSTRGASSSRTSACARRSISHSISSGRTRTCSSVSTQRTQSYFENSDMKAAGPPIAGRS